MSTRDKLLRDAIGASKLHTAGIDQAFIIDYLVERLTFEHFRSNYLLRIHSEALRKKIGSHHEGKGAALSMGRIFIPYFERFDELFGYRGDARLVALVPQFDMTFYLIDRTGATECDDTAYWMLAGYRTLMPIFAAHGIPTGRLVRSKCRNVLLVDRRRRFFYAADADNVIDTFSENPSWEADAAKSGDDRPSLSPGRVRLAMESELLRLYGDAEVGPDAASFAEYYVPRSRSMVSYGLN